MGCGVSRVKVVPSPIKEPTEARWGQRVCRPAANLSQAEDVAPKTFKALLHKLQEDLEKVAQDLGIDIFKQHEACEWFLGRAKPPVFGDDEVVRVLQWNVLAEGLSNDGFLVQDS
eukprot:9500658-Pyramimonas_sp.AAC.1